VGTCQHGGGGYMSARRGWVEMHAANEQLLLYLCLANVAQVGLGRKRDSQR
jgi:hypothetical protein